MLDGVKMVIHGKHQTFYGEEKKQNTSVNQFIIYVKKHIPLSFIDLILVW